jgi:hypothetical protein
MGTQGVGGGETLSAVCVTPSQAAATICRNVIPFGSTVCVRNTGGGRLIFGETNRPKTSHFVS